MATRKIEVQLIGDASSLSRAFGKGGRDAETFGKQVHGHGTKALKVFAAAAGGVAVVGIGLLAKGLKDGVEQNILHEKSSAQTASAIKATGHAAGVTVPHVEALANKIEKMSGQDDLAVQAGENMLLTFKNIRNGVGENNKIFDRTTMALADMTTAMGSDPQKTAIQLGKALNDPVKGLTALTRVGVTFTDQQKKNIKAMVEHGNVAGAQKIILKELESEFGGSAKAAGTTMAGQVNILKARLEDLEQKIAEKIMPILIRFLGWVTENWPKFAEVVQTAAKAVQEAYPKYIKPFVDAAIALFKFLVGQVRGHWDDIKAHIDGVLKVIKGIIDVFAGVLKGDWGRVWKGITEIVSGAWDTIKADLRLAISILGGLALKVGEAIFDKLKDGVTGIAGKVGELIGRIPGAINGLLGTIRSAALDIGKGIISGILGGLGGLREALINAIQGAAQSAIDTVTGLFSSGGNPKGATGKTPQVPKYTPKAMGGIVSRPTFSLIGEAGPEAIIPLSNPARARQVMREAGLAGGGGGITFNINGSNMDPRQLLSTASWMLRTGGLA